MRTSTGDGVGLVGIGAAACLACCAGPMLAVLGGLGLTGLAGTLLIGAAGLVATAGAVIAVLVVRRRTTCALPDDGPVTVAAPTRRLPASTEAR